MLQYRNACLCSDEMIIKDFRCRFAAAVFYEMRARVALGLEQFRFSSEHLKIVFSSKCSFLASYVRKMMSVLFHIRKSKILNCTLENFRFAAAKLLFPFITVLLEQVLEQVLEQNAVAKWAN